MSKFTLDKKSWFYKNCKQQRKREAKICQVCPFREWIEKEEKPPTFNCPGCGQHKPRETAACKNGVYLCSDCYGEESGDE